ncbi:hypothetical protein MBLNU13_g08752t1 [Cladosporium sp. NU13]
MPKRKAVQAPIVDDSDLSPPPNDLDEGAAALANANTDLDSTTQPTKKRKTASSIVKSETVTKATNETGITTQNRTTRTRKVKAEPEEDPNFSSEEAPKPTPKKRQPKAKIVKKEEAEEEEEEPAKEKPAKKKRKTKEEKEAEAMPLSARTIGHKLFIGAHVSSAGGVQNAPLNSVHIGANAFALFLKSQRKWVNPPILTEAVDGFHANCKHHSYNQNEHVVPHGSYLVNLAHTDPARTKQAYDAFVDDLKRCERLGIKLYNFHPGVANSTNGDKGKAIAHLASNINRAHKETSTVVTLLENMAAGGNVLGSTFEDLRDTIALIDDKSRVGVCLDTCHAFAGGYDLRTPEAFAATMDDFERIVGVKYLRALHVNDSKAPLSSHRDLHANIGTGFLGLRAFHNVVNEPRFAGLPLVLETPIEVRDADGQLVKDEKGKAQEDKNIWATEIKLLERMVGMDVESEEFLNLEADLSRKGKPERDRLAEQIEKKKEKEAAKGTKKGKGKGKKIKDEESDLSDVGSESGE